MINIQQALTEATTKLTLSSSSARLDAEVLLAMALNSSRAFLYAYPEKILTDTCFDAYNKLLIKRLDGIPIAYLTGVREFWSMPLKVNNSTLIPRPETELLVELTLELLNNIHAPLVLDLGTGSGAVALALASERHSWRLIACDKCENAVLTARENAAMLKLTNVDVVCSDWFESIQNSSFNAIVSNPPYIADNDPHLTEGDVRFEPKSALASGIDGLADLTYIIKNSYARLQPNGLLLLEHGAAQGDAVISILKACGYQQVQCWQDYQGLDRVSGGRKS